MKKLVLTFAMVASLAATAAATEVADTIKVVENPQSVIVTRTPDGLTNVMVVSNADDKEDAYYSYTSSVMAIDVPGNQITSDEEWGLSLPFLKAKKVKKTNYIWFQQTYIGIPFVLSGPTGLDQSIECGIGQLVGVSWKPCQSGPGFSIGVGIHYEQYSLHAGRIFGKDGDRLTINPLGEEYTDPSSRLRNFGFTVPVTINQSIYEGFSVSVGVGMRFNTFTKATSSFSKDNVRYKRDFKSLQQRELNYELYGAIGWDDVAALYVRYTPVSLFKSAYGPRFETLSIGITLGM